MDYQMKPIIVIPARGGSKGIPRKNLRPLGGVPLIAHSIRAALASQFDPRIVVSTDDDEIEFFARQFGAEVIRRPVGLATDKIPLDPVIVHAVETAEQKWQEAYDTVITVQPTAPFVTAADIDKAIHQLRVSTLETIISAVEDRHLRWIETPTGIKPDYEKRVNRQQLPMTYRETGAVIACKRDTLNNGTRIGHQVELLLIDKERSVDIDDYHDWWLSESIFGRKKIVFVVIGRHNVGLGHAYRSVMIAHELMRHEVVFVCKEEDDAAIQYIQSQNYHVVTCKNSDVLETVINQKPFLVINDILDTSADYIAALKKQDIITLNFEDLGLGAEIADLVINDLYPHQIPSERILVGPRYFCLRDEFLHTPEAEYNSEVRRILITFGGTDAGSITHRVIGLLGGELVERGIDVDVVLGPGYLHHQELGRLIDEIGSTRIRVISKTSKISEYMQQADMAITSGGRTVLELASLKVPSIVICQNQRETTHSYASSENGIINLGCTSDITDIEIRSAIMRLIEDPALRQTMRKKMGAMDLKAGKRRVVDLIEGLLAR